MIGSRTRSPCLVFLSFWLFGCTATRVVDEVNQKYIAPEERDFERSIDFDGVEYNRVWEVIIGFFASRQISIDTIEKDSGIVVAKKMISDRSDAEAIADLGIVKSRVRKVKQWLKPSQFAGSANYWVVQSTGTVTESKPIEGTQVESEEMPSFRVAVAFNVFVERFAGGRLRTTINTSMETTQEVELYNGWAWSGKNDSNSVANTSEIIQRLRPHLPPSRVVPRARSKGLFEKAFLDHLRKGVSGS